MSDEVSKKKQMIPDELLGALLEATKPVDPGTERTQFMLAEIKSRIHQPSEQARPITDLLTVAKKSGEWVEPMPGNQLKMLRSDADTQSFLVRLQPGTRFPAHYHPQDEETLVLEGSVCFGDIKLETGDYHLARMGSSHEEVFSANGCLLFIRAGTEQNA